MKLVYDFLKWAITDHEATDIAIHHDYASLPVKFARSVLTDHLNTIKCANDDAQTTFRPIMDQPPTSQALNAHGTGSNMMQGLIYALLDVYSGAGSRLVRSHALLTSFAPHPPACPPRPAPLLRSCQCAAASSALLTVYPHNRPTLRASVPPQGRPP
jgi:hypothetical protein